MTHQRLRNFTNFTLEALARCKRLMACAVAILGVLAFVGPPLAFGHTPCRCQLHHEGRRRSRRRQPL